MSENKLIVDFLNVGFGESICIRATGTKPLNILVDGGDNRQDVFACRRNRIKLSQYLSGEGIRDIDLLVITHLHQDHLGGIHEVISDISVREAWVNYLLPQEFHGGKVSSEGSNIENAIDMYDDIFRILKKNGTKIRLIEEDMRWTRDISDNSLRITGMTPGKQLLAKLNKDMEMIYRTTNHEERKGILQEVDEFLNRTCIVVKIDYLGTGILLCSDAPLSFWKQFNDTENLKAVILKAPHHGDIEHINRELLSAVGAKYLVISADGERTYNLPSPETKSLAESMGLEVIYTEDSDLNESGCGKENSVGNVVRFNVGYRQVAYSRHLVRQV
ncbi:MAG TPA: MBL fold metallo-hydrolase [Bacillota bacterium]|nr:MBL fold metallo-hydrolase [Bacillota bacterium]